MPKHKRESLIYTVMMCFVMVLWMSVYNVTLHMGQFGVETLKEAWLGFPVAYIFAMVFDWFVNRPCARGEKAMKPVPFSLACCRIPSSSGSRLKMLYLP